MGKSSFIARKLVKDYIERDILTAEALMNLYPNLCPCEYIDEVVHHINRNQSDNRLENLYVFRNRYRHQEYHNDIRIWSYGLCGLTLDAKIEYLKSFPDLISNLDLLKKIAKNESALKEYILDGT